MDWLNIKVTHLKQPQFVGAKPIDRATWLCLMAYCVSQENGGIITDCGAWDDRTWQQSVGISLKEVKRVCGLWTFIGTSLAVWQYPKEKEVEVKVRRQEGKKAADKRWSAAIGIATPNGSPNGSPIPTPTANGNAEEEREEEREKEVEEEKPKRFAPPSLDELEAEFQRHGYNGKSRDMAERFHAYYQSKGWKVGNSAMKSWPDAVITWKKREPPPEPPKPREVAT